MLMNYKKISLLSAFLLMGCFVLLIGTSYARYQERITADYTLLVRKPATFQIIQEETWTRSGDVEVYPFSISNQENESDTYFTIRFATTIGMQIDGASLRLLTENTAGIQRGYDASVNKLPEDSISYQEIGEGFEYIFLDENGEERVWKLEGGQLSMKDFVLEIVGAEKSNLIQIIVSETKPNE